MPPIPVPSYAPAVPGLGPMALVLAAGLVVILEAIDADQSGQLGD